MVARDRPADRGPRLAAHVEHLFSSPRLRHRLVLGQHEPVARGRRDQQLSARHMGEQRHHPRLVRHVGHQPHRLAHASPARQQRGLERVHPPVRGEHQNAVGRLGVDKETRPVAVLELQLRRGVDMAFHGPDPAHLGADHRHRFALDHGFERDLLDIGRVVERRASRAAGSGLAERLADFLELVRDPRPLQVLGGQQRGDPRALGDQRVALGAQLHLLEPAQVAQPQVQDRFGLHVRERELRDQHGLRLVLVADDLDHPVEIEERDDVPVENLQPRVDFAQPELRPPDQNLAPMIQKRPQHLAQRADLRRAPVDQNVHVHREARLEIAVLEQHLHHHLRIDVARARLQHHADVLCALVAHVGQNGNLLGVDKIGQPFDQLALLNLIGDLGDHDLPGPAPQILDRPARPHTEPAFAGAVGLLDARALLDDDPAGREIRALDVIEQRLVARVRRFDQMQAGAHQLVDVVRRDVGRHADRDAGRSVRQQVGERRRQDHRLALRAVVIVAEIDRVLGQAVQQRRRRRRQPRLGVALRRRVVAVDIAEIALAVDQRIADVEILRQPGQRVIDRLVAMRVIVAHHLADDLGAFAERRGRLQLQPAHRVEDAPMHRLEPVARVRKRPVHDRAERVGQIPLAQRPIERLRGLAVTRHVGGVGQVSHRCGDTAVNRTRPENIG